MSERDLAEAIHHEIVSPESVDAALDLWAGEWRGESSDRDRIWFLLASVSSHAIDAVLARRVSEAARTGPWDAPCDERERCARHIEARAVAIRDHGPTTADGLLTGIAGAQVGALLDAAASLRTGRGDAP